MVLFACSGPFPVCLFVCFFKYAGTGVRASFMRAQWVSGKSQCLLTTKAEKGPNCQHYPPRTGCHCCVEATILMGGGRSRGLWGMESMLGAALSLPKKIQVLPEFCLVLYCHYHFSWKVFWWWSVTVNGGGAASSSHWLRLPSWSSSLWWKRQTYESQLWQWEQWATEDHTAFHFFQALLENS